MKISLSLLSILLVCSVDAGAQTRAVVQPAQAAATQQTAPAKTVSTDEKKIDPAKEKDIRELLELTGAKDRMTQVMTEMEKSIKPMMQTALPPGDYRDKLIDAFFDKFHSKMNLAELLNLSVPIYDKHFTHAEIKGLLAFYKTPLGQKSINELPQLMGEMMNAGQKWGEDLGRTSMFEVLAEHPEYEKSMEEAQKNGQQQPQNQ
jgi:uncharacterized protein